MTDRIPPLASGGEGDWEWRIGQHVRRLRKARRWTQEELGQKLGMHQVSVAKLEAAKRPIRVNELVLLGQIFGVPYYAFMGRPTDTTEIAKMEEGYAALQGQLEIALRAFAQVERRKAAINAELSEFADRISKLQSTASDFEAKLVRMRDKEHHD